MSNKQLSFLSEKSSLEEHLKKIGVKLEEYTDPHSARKGLPVQGEISALAFFPKLSVGLKTKNDEYKIKHRKKKYETDLRIIRKSDLKIVGWVDVETRVEDGGDFIFKPEGKYVPLNFPIHSHRSNWEDWPEEKKFISGKIIRYRNSPLSSFDLKLRFTRNEGLCTWAYHIIKGFPCNQQTRGGLIFKVYRVSRNKVCYGRINEETIEDFVIEKLLEGGFIK